jgi:hypothetical protein
MWAESNLGNHYTPQEPVVAQEMVPSVEKTESWVDDPAAGPESWSFPGKTIDIVHNSGTWEAESGVVPVAQGPENSSYQGNEIDVDRNPQDPEITETN